MDVLSNRPHFIVQYRLHLCLLMAVKSLLLFVFETSVRSNLAPSADREEKSVNQYLAAEITQLFFGWTPRIRTAVVDEKTCVTLEPPVRPFSQGGEIAAPRKDIKRRNAMPGLMAWSAMTKRFCRSLVLAPGLFGVVSMAAPAFAQVADVGGTADVEEQTAAQVWRLTVGLGAAIVPDYVGSDNYTIAALPKLRAEKGPYYADLTGPFLSSNVLPTQTWQLGPAGQFIKGDRCNSSDNTVNNMKCQSDAFMLGAQAAYNFRLTEASRLSPKARMLFDVTGANDGYTFEPLVEYANRFSKRWGLLLQSNLIVGSENYENYYFGVTGPQSRQSGLKTYNADGGVQQFGFTAVGSYNATESIRVDLIGRYQRLVGDAADSPLVDGTSNSRGAANQFIFGVIGAYTF